ncbi:hypothetical protein PUN28_006645 [Cardiocondyla obscurior]|uniref:Uncharacterized protein n=1 Tax=Cardiocondyla obscurior TaxID=286306 RepID=A0AAW2GCG7_9HYME
MLARWFQSVSQKRFRKQIYKCSLNFSYDIIHRSYLISNYITHMANVNHKLLPRSQFSDQNAKFEIFHEHRISNEAIAKWTEVKSSQIEKRVVILRVK